LALAAAMSESTAAQWQFASEDESSARLALEAQGVSIVDLDETACAAFKRAVRAVIEQGYSALPQEIERE
jgi:TRAP-type C4-dicarboxylate transport system substrate-binding protein